MSLRDVTRQKTKKAIRGGLIKIAKKCSACNTQKKLEVHHLDYKDYLNIIWLCKKCHVKWHKENVCLSIEVSLTHNESKALHLIRTKEHRTIKNQVKWIIRSHIKNSKYSNILDSK